MQIKALLKKHSIPDWAQWLAQDADGSWWVYEAEPHQHSTGWYENEVGRCWKLEQTDANPSWQESLEKIYP